jgi:pimeloyl-ACP methyl ester carboxylesterase
MYFSHSDDEGIKAFLDSVQPAEPINLIGHSWGGDTAGNIAVTYRRRINLLITVDPVGHWPSEVPRPEYPQPGRPPLADYTSFYMLIRSNCDQWVDVDAITDAWYHESNVIAGLGGPWGVAVRDIAHLYIDAKGHDHRDFAQMMGYTDKNVAKSALNILTGGR